MGKRLKLMTGHVPKPLVPLNNTPIIECAKK
jgi:NDP-sugar pyrophosphorylase family protein